MELDGNKWTIEYQDGDPNIKIKGEISHTVNIFSCKNSTIKVDGKVNAINLVSCQKIGIVLDSVVSSLSITSSPSFQAQILGKAPTILIDSTDSGMIYLSKECLDAEIITAKTSSINVLLPPTGEDGDFDEKPVPEQMKTVVVDGKLVTSIVEHAG